MTYERDDLIAALKLGEPSGREWRDYVTELDLTEADVPLLRELILDEELGLADYNSEEVWVPLHAWRAYSQLPDDDQTRFETYFEMLLFANEIDDDWFPADFINLIVVGGEPMATLLMAKLPEVAQLPEFVAAILFEALENVTTAVPELRETVIEELVKVLESYKELSRFVNGAIVSTFIGLKAQSAYPLIEQAYMDNRVDQMFTGTLADIQAELGFPTNTLPDAPTKRALMDILTIDEAVDLPLERTMFLRSFDRQKPQGCPACGTTMVNSDMAYLLMISDQPLGEAGNKEIIVATSEGGWYCVECPSVLLHKPLFDERVTEMRGDGAYYAIMGLIDPFQIDNVDMDKPLYEFERMPVTEFIPEGAPGALSEKKKSYVRKRRMKKKRRR